MDQHELPFAVCSVAGTAAEAAVGAAGTAARAAAKAAAEAADIVAAAPIGFAPGIPDAFAAVAGHHYYHLCCSSLTEPHVQDQTNP